MTGLSPFGYGAWENANIDSFHEELAKSKRVLATQAARYYGGVYPDEPLGQVAELYLEHLIFPPAMMSEGAPYCDAANSLYEFSKQFQVSPQALKQLSRNLSRSPMPQIAGAGLVLSLVLSSEIDLQVLAASETKAASMAVLRPAILRMSEVLGVGNNWIEAESFDDVQRKRFEFERLHELIPWIKLSADAIKSLFGREHVKELLLALSNLDHAQSVWYISQLVEETPGSLELRAQQIYLEMISGDLEGTHDSLRKLVTEPGAEGFAPLYDLWGFCCLLREDFENALRYSQKAYDLCGEEQEQFSGLRQQLRLDFS